MNRLQPESPSSPPAWLGLLWVYAASFWLWRVSGPLLAGEFQLALPAGLRLIVTLAIGIGLCAGERWAWATAAVLVSLYAALTALGALTAGWAVSRLPSGWPSWREVLIGMNASTTLGTALLLTSAAAICAGTLWILWQRREGYEVERRRAFTALVQDGVIPAIGVLLLDGWTFREFWLAGKW